MTDPRPKPDAQDRQNYNYDIKTSPFYEAPENFLKLGQRVRAKIRIWDLPHSEPDWGWVTAEAGTEGVVEWVQPGFWPFVRFANGRGSDVTDFEVEALPAEADFVKVYQDYIDDEDAS